MKNSDQTGIDISFLVEGVAGSDAPQGEAVEDTDTPTPEFSENSPEQSRATIIASFALDHDYFGLDATQEDIPRWIVETLMTLENDKQHYVPDFDISAVSPSILAPLVQELRTQFEREAIQADIMRRDEIYQAYLTAFAGRPVSEIFTALAVNNKIPEAIQLKAAAYAQILSPDVVKNKADRDAIVAKINQYSLVSIPAPYWFVSSEILGDKDLSEKTHKAIAKEFSLDPHSINGAALMSALNSVNEEGQSLYASENKLALGDGIDSNLEAYTTENGQGMITFETADGSLDFPIDATESPRTLGLKLSLLKIWVATNGELFFGEDIGPQESGVNSIELDRMQRIFEAILGGSCNYDGEILTEDLISDIVALSAFVSNLDHAAALNLIEVGSNAVDTETLAMIALFIRNQVNTESIDMDALYTHLNLLRSPQIVGDEGNESDNIAEDNPIETNIEENDEEVEEAA